MVHFSLRSAVQALFGLATMAAAAPNPQSATDGSNPTYSDESDFQSQMLNSTNTYRKLYGAQSVAWNNTLASYAQNAADGCVFAHTGGPYGENIAEGYASTQDTCQAWGDERFEYSWSNPVFSEVTGHFTQLVWKSTTTVGCGRSFCGGSKGWYVVCEYWPRGNVIGSFAQEVGTLVNGAVNGPVSSSSATPSATIPMQTKAPVASAEIPVFTGAAERPHIRSGAAMVGVIGALVAMA